MYHRCILRQKSGIVFTEIDPRMSLDIFPMIEKEHDKFRH